jgi:hypothetical protein
MELPAAMVECEISFDQRTNESAADSRLGAATTM